MCNCYSKIKYTLILAIGGIGKRMGIDYPKQFIEYKKKPLFMNIIGKIEKEETVDNIIIVTREELISKVEKLCYDYNVKKVSNIVIGGNERQESVYNALKLCDEDSIIAVQDGVRPFMKKEYLKKPYDLLLENKNINGVVIGVKAKDTIKMVDKDGFIINTPDRKTLFLAQTPQVFRGKCLKEAYKMANSDKLYGTDDSSLVERYFGNVVLMEGSYENIKITTPEDLKYLK